MTDEEINERLSEVLSNMGMYPAHNTDMGVCSCDENSDGVHYTDHEMLGTCLRDSLRKVGLDVYALTPTWERAQCKGCGKGFDRPHRRGRPHLYCDDCRANHEPQHVADRRRRSPGAVTSEV